MKKRIPPFHPLCAKAGHCCFDQAYIIGRLDERNGLPGVKKPKPKKQKASGKAGLGIERD